MSSIIPNDAFKKCHWLKISNVKKNWFAFIYFFIAVDKMILLAFCEHIKSAVVGANNRDRIKFTAVFFCDGKFGENIDLRFSESATDLATYVAANTLE